MGLKKPRSYIKTKDGIIDTSDRMLDGDRCPHGKFVAVQECPEDCEYYINGKLQKYYLESIHEFT